MPTLTIKGVPPWDGDYEFDSDIQFTGHEWRVIKQVAGVRGGEFDEALEAGDVDLIIALAIIVAKRAGKTIPAEELLNSTLGSITLKPDEADAVPLDQSSPNGNGDKQHATSGSDSKADGDRQENPQKVTGIRG